MFLVYSLRFTVYGLQMITVQAIRFVYSLKFIVYSLRFLRPCGSFSRFALWKRQSRAASGKAERTDDYMKK